MPDLSQYAAILASDKWISRLDFIYKIKSNLDCESFENRKLLQFLYSVQFSFVQRNEEGQIVFWY
jgi:hypothetical protein